MSNASTYDELQERKYDAHPLLRQIIDRDCHVGISNRAVIRHVIAKLRDGYQAFRDMPSEDRRTLMKQCIDIHKANRAEYRAVMYPRYSDEG